MARLVRLAEVNEARARLASAPEQETLKRSRVRQLWQAADLLAGSDTGIDSTVQAQLVLHRDAVRLARASQPGVLLALTDASTLPLLEQLLATDAPSLSEADATLALGVARSAHRRALELLETDGAVVRRYAQQRIGALGAAFFITVALALGAFALVVRLRLPTDLAKGKPFTLSSSWTTCHPDEGECGGFPMKIAFHTTEQDNPWYQVDLGEPTDFSWLTIRNRTDVAMMRAIPLVVELSDDGTTFREVARRTENFVEWEPILGRQRARFVRVRVPRVTTLHLEAVRVHR